jgi:hypothetical protein
MIGQLVFMASLAIVAGAVLWRAVRKKSKKSCCE